MLHMGASDNHETGTNVAAIRNCQLHQGLWLQCFLSLSTGTSAPVVFQFNGILIRRDCQSYERISVSVSRVPGDSSSK